MIPCETVDLHQGARGTEHKVRVHVTSAGERVERQALRAVRTGGRLVSFIDVKSCSALVKTD